MKEYTIKFDIYCGEAGKSIHKEERMAINADTDFDAVWKAISEAASRSKQYDLDPTSHKTRVAITELQYDGRELRQRRLLQNHWVGLKAIYNHNIGVTCEGSIVISSSGLEERVSNTIPEAGGIGLNERHD